MTRAYVPYLRPVNVLADSREEDRHRDLERRTGHLRAIRESAERLPDGTIGRTQILLVGGEWTAVCAVA